MIMTAKGGWIRRDAATIPGSRQLISNTHESARLKPVDP
jgi:hypothetical protein